MHPEPSGPVVRRTHDPAVFCPPREDADDDRPFLERRVCDLFDLGVEVIEVDVPYDSVQSHEAEPVLRLRGCDDRTGRHWEFAHGGCYKGKAGCNGRVAVVAIRVVARSGDSRSLSHLYWGWIRQVVAEEGVILPQSGSETDRLSEQQAKKLASALRTRADKIRKGIAPRDASAYVQGLDKRWFPQAEEPSAGTVRADFGDPDDMEATARFFDSSGGVTLRY